MYLDILVLIDTNKMSSRMKSTNKAKEVAERMTLTSKEMKFKANSKVSKMRPGKENLGAYLKDFVRSL